MNNKQLLIAFFFMLIAITAHAQQKGKATFYSKRATGARTASGERLHHDSLTCAHRTYPFGTLVKVTNLNNGKTVLVRVTDRGPFAKGRIIDLSYAAAKQLDMLFAGVATVTVERYNRGVPYDDEPAIELPELDLEMATQGYSMVDDWRGRDNMVDDKIENDGQKIANNRKKQQGKAAIIAPNETKKPAKTPSKKDKENKWNKVFERIKKIF